MNLCRNAFQGGIFVLEKRFFTCQVNLKNPQYLIRLRGKGGLATLCLGLNPNFFPELKLSPINLPFYCILDNSLMKMSHFHFNYLQMHYVVALCLRIAFIVFLITNLSRREGFRRLFSPLNQSNHLCLHFQNQILKFTTYTIKTPLNQSNHLCLHFQNQILKFTTYTIKNSVHVRLC